MIEQKICGPVLEDTEDVVYSGEYGDIRFIQAGYILTQMAQISQTLDEDFYEKDPGKRLSEAGKDKLVRRSSILSARMLYLEGQLGPSDGLYLPVTESGGQLGELVGNENGKGGNNNGIDKL